MVDKVQQIIKNISNLSSNSHTLLIGVDGISGAGKTTLALLIKQKLSNVSVITTDDFWDNSLGKVNTEQLKNDLLEPLSKNREGYFLEYNGNTKQRDKRQVLAEGIIIIEGIYALHSSISDYYNYKIWIEMEEKESDMRVKTRGDWYEKEKYMSDIRKKEKEYMKNDNPKGRADFVIDNNQISTEVPKLEELWESFTK